MTHELELPTKWSNYPFSPKRFPFFYGWIIVAACTVGILSSVPGQTIGVGVFTDDLIRGLGLSRVRLSTAYMLGTITSSFMLPLAGRLIDRFGTRVAIVVSALGLALSIVIISQCDRIVGLTGSGSFWVALGVAYISFMLIRFFGQGCLTMTSKVTISKWFNHRRGLATATATCFVAFGFSSSPTLLNWLVQAFTWRATYLFLALGVGLGTTVIGWVFYRDNPEQCGLEMDGVDDPAWHQRMSERVAQVYKQFTRREALKTGVFWLFNAGAASQSLMITAVTFHIASIGREMGLDRGASYALFIPMAVFSVLTSLIGGWASDRMRLKWLLIIMMTAQALGTTGLLNMGDPLWRWAFIAGYGVSGGFLTTLFTVAWPRFYGRVHLGAITGLHTSILVFASAIGPVLFSSVQTLTDSYREIGFACWFIPVAVIFWSAWAANPQEKLAETYNE